ncbi:MAG: nucleotidyltransferase domain-containing protein [Candidatus Woesearchaeota archaeon]
MEFTIEKRKKVDAKRFHPQHMEIAYEFSKKIYKELKDFIKALVLFGSTARGITSNDIDILIIVDDVNVQLTKELVQTYRLIVEQTVLRTSKRLHITTMKLTSFWEYIKNGDPIVLNILRDGVSILDTGFFDPIQALLAQGRIRPTKESIWNYFNRSPISLHNSKWHILQATLDLYWAVIDSAHAALMKLGCVPETPENVASLLEEKMVKPGLLHKKYPKTMEHFYNVGKLIMHNELREISGEHYDHYYREAKEFVEVMQDFIKKK